MVHEAHLLALRALARLGVRTAVESDDRCPRRRRQRHIALCDRAGARLTPADADLVGRQAVERINNRLARTLHSAIDEHPLVDEDRKSVVWTKRASVSVDP